MFRSERWWQRELARREREWTIERAELVATVCHLASRPLRRSEQQSDFTKPTKTDAVRGWTATPEQRPLH